MQPLASAQAWAAGAELPGEPERRGDQGKGEARWLGKKLERIPQRSAFLLKGGKLHRMWPFDSLCHGSDRIPLVG